MCFSLAYWQVERERRKLKKESIRASRAGSLEMREAVASSPTQQVTCFSHLPLSSCPYRHSTLCSAYPSVDVEWPRESREHPCPQSVLALGGGLTSVGNYSQKQWVQIHSLPEQCLRFPGYPESPASSGCVVLSSPRF